MAPLAAFAQEVYDYGLSMVSYPAKLYDYSGLVLCDGKPVPLGNHPLTLSFDLFTREDCIFGTIARVVTDDGDKMDLIYSESNSGIFTVAFVSGGKLNVICPNAVIGKWIRVSMTFSKASGEVSVSYDDASADFPVSLLKGAKGLSFSFGSGPGEAFQSNDIASVDLRNISILQEDEVLYEWPLDTHDGDISYDMVSSSPAVAVNPRWTIDKYMYWGKVGSVNSENWISYAFDGGNRFFFTSSDGAVTEMSAADGAVSVTRASGPLPVNAPDLMVWETGPEKLLFYNLDSDFYSVFDDASRSWSGEALKNASHCFFNKTSSWDPSRGLLYSFGGYGHHLYNNVLTVVDPTDPSSRKDITLEEIMPRYCSTSCLVGDRLYIFGGRGSDTGKQELSPRTVCDLYSVDVNTFQVTKLWETAFEDTEVGEAFLPGGSMVYDSAEDVFYAITNYDGISLMKIGREVPVVSPVSKITEKPDAQYVYKSLYLDGKSELLYAVIEGSQSDGKSELGLWRLHWPPYPVSKAEAPADDEKKGILGWIIAFALLLAAAGAVLLLNYRRREAKAEDEASEAGPEEGTGFKPVYYTDKKSSISFLGHFNVTDREGNDITSQFSPISKNLLILLVLLSEKYPGGIPGNIINSMIWSYKDESSANNTRNVFMYKLRSLLESVGEVNIFSQNKLWKAEFGDDVFCDYLEARRLFSETPDEETVNRLLELLMRGMLLPGIDLDWVDAYKGEFSNQVIDFLEKRLNSKQLSDNLRLSIADAIFKYDYLNEEALQAKCRIFYNQGKSGLAKKDYDAFCRHYKDALDIVYPVSLKDIVDG